MVHIYGVYLLVALVAKVPRKKNGEKKQIKSRGRKWLPLRSLQLSISMHAASMLGMLLAIIFTLDITTGIDATLLINNNTVNTGSSSCIKRRG